jgi:hypothetical protein
MCCFMQYNFFGDKDVTRIQITILSIVTYYAYNSIIFSSKQHIIFVIFNH